MADSNTHPDLQDEIIQTLRDLEIKGDDIDFVEMAMSLNIDASMKKLRKYLESRGLATKADWNQALKIRKVINDLGFYPKSASDYLERYISENGIAVNFQKAIKKAVVPTIDGNAVTAEARKDVLVDAVARIQENADVTLDSLMAELRIKARELGLLYNREAIADVTGRWFKASLAARITEVYLQVAKGHEGPNSVGNVAAWDAVASQFDTSEFGADFVIAVLKKFIWQVKRKMIGLPIDNHLMPVLTGPQGTGKSTFVREVLLKPISELVLNSNFDEIAEGRNSEQWRFYAHFFDEMGHAQKTDIDVVKNLITASHVSSRTMYTNDVQQVPQHSTFIGCSNKELNQLIRDETGIRRFVALRYASNPQWSKINEIDPVTLWTSVDERGDDPTLPIAATLKAAQAAMREQSVVEMWLGAWTVPMATYGKKQKASAMYPDFKEWCLNFASGRMLDLNMFGKELTRLINSGNLPDWKRSSLNGTAVYTYK